MAFLPLIQDLTGCSTDMEVLIETFDRDWTFFYDVVDDVKISISNSPSSHPIPYGTEITDNIMRNMDRITITGAIGCLRCGGILSAITTLFGWGDYNNTMGGVVSELKRLSDRMIYDREGFVTLTSNHWLATHMILTDVEIGISQDDVQKMEITTTWVGANLTGSIGQAAFIRGGIYYAP